MLSKADTQVCAFSEIDSCMHSYLISYLRGYQSLQSAPFYMTSEHSLSVQVGFGSLVAHISLPFLNLETLTADNISRKQPQRFCAFSKIYLTYIVVGSQTAECTQVHSL